MSRKTRFFNIIPAVAFLGIAGCQSVPVISCPPPPDAAMVSPSPLQPLPERELSAREVFGAWAEDIAAYRINAARLTALQDWGRTQCGWSTPQSPP